MSVWRWAWILTLSATAAQNLVVSAKGTRAVLQNTRTVPVEAWAVRCGSQTSIRDAVFEAEAAVIEAGASAEIDLASDAPRIRTALIYTDGQVAGEPDLLEEIAEIRVHARQLIPSIERELGQLAARALSPADYIRRVEAWARQTSLKARGSTQQAFNRVTARVRDVLQSTTTDRLDEVVDQSAAALVAIEAAIDWSRDRIDAGRSRP